MPGAPSAKGSPVSGAHRFVAAAALAVAAALSDPVAAAFGGRL